MQPNQVFDIVCDEIVRSTEMPVLAARGTVRLALKEAGLDPAYVSTGEMQVVGQTLLPRYLESRGFPAADLATQLRARLLDVSDDSSRETPEQIFSRLAGGNR